MNRRMMGQEKSLNSPIKAGETDEWQDWLLMIIWIKNFYLSQQQEYEDRKELLKNAMNILNERESNILKLEDLMKILKH